MSSVVNDNVVVYCMYLNIWPFVVKALRVRAHKCLNVQYLWCISSKHANAEGGQLWIRNSNNILELPSYLLLPESSHLLIIKLDYHQLVTYNTYWVITDFSIFLSPSLVTFHTSARRKRTVMSLFFTAMVTDDLHHRMYGHRLSSCI
jgi:hypothetical protein